MRYLFNKVFQRDLKHHELGEEYLKELLGNILAGRARSLGFKMFKIRAARRGKGKSSGFRNIFFWKQAELIIFCVLFSKNEKVNLDSKEIKALKLLSQDYESCTEDEIEKRISNNEFWEIHYD